MTEPPLVSPRLLAAWIAAAVLTFVVSLALLLHSDDVATDGPSTFSVSAIGQAGIADMLRHHGLTVIKSRGDSLHKLGPGGLLVLAEPELGVTPDPGQQALLHAPNLLLVLPKWQGDADDRHSGWISQADTLPLFVPQSVLGIVLGKATVIRPDAALAWTRNDIGPLPHLTAPPQLMTAPRLRPVVSTDAGMLVGELQRGKQRVWVVSDPDVIDNHGLADGNAAFALALFDRLHTGGTVVFDETVHGFAAVPANPMTLLLHRPFSEVAAQGLLALLVLVWACLGRFGAPEAAPPPLKAGKRDLVRNTAELFRYARHQRVLVRRYVDETIRDVARGLHAPRDLDEAETLSWLQRLGNRCGVTQDCAELRARAAALAAHRGPSDHARLPLEIWRWKQEMMHGIAGSAGTRAGDPRRSPQGGGRPG
jgi:hypothetical protein